MRSLCFAPRPESGNSPSRPWGMRTTNLILVALFVMPSTGCLGAFVAGKIVDEATCAAGKGFKRRQAHLDITISEPSTLDVGWEGKTRRADCDSNAGLGGEDGAFVFFDEFDDGETTVGFLLADENGLQGEVPTALVIDGRDDQDVLFWAGLNCTTQIIEYEDLDNGYAYIEGAGECYTIPFDDDEEPELATEYSFANIVLNDPWAAAARCC